MKKIKLVFLLSVIHFLSFAQTNNPQKLDSIFSALSRQNQFNGSVLIAEKGKVIFAKGYGYRNETTRQLNNPQTVFELASCSKQFTAAAIVLLKRQGKLQYEDKISRFLPELSFWNEVTIYDLLRHTSGVPYYMADMAKDWDKTKIATNEDVIRFYALRKDTLQFTPGSRHRYNNTNYALLASIVERASGERFGDFLSEHIFRPLHMNNTLVYNRRQDPGTIDNYATGYVWAKGSFRKVISEDPLYNDSSVYYLDGIVGEAKVNSNAEDIFKWITALQHHSFFTPSEFEEMTEITRTSEGKNIPYGFGFDLVKGENKFAFGHTGSWDGYVSFIHQNVIKDRTIIILQNFQMGVFPYENITQILDNQPVNANYRQKIVLQEADIKKYAGTYINEQDKQEEHIITYLDGHLFYNTPEIAWDLRFFPVATAEFQAIRRGGMDGSLRFSGTDNGDIKLEMLQNGNVVGTGIRKRQD